MGRNLIKPALTDSLYYLINYKLINLTLFVFLREKMIETGREDKNGGSERRQEEERRETISWPAKFSTFAKNFQMLMMMKLLQLLQKFSWPLDQKVKGIKVK